MEIATFVVTVDAPDDYPSDEGSADELSRLEMRAARAVELTLAAALTDLQLPEGFEVSWTRTF